MMRKLVLAVVPVLALSGAVRADEIEGLADAFASESSFEIDALTAAFDDSVVADDEIAPVAGSEATDVDAEAACFGFGFRRAWGYGYGGWRGYGCWNSCYRPFYGYGGGFGGYCYRPVYRFYGSYCW